MQELLNMEYWKSYFKYFSFRYKQKTIQRIYYKNAIYEGQCQFDEIKQIPIKNGVGIYLTNKGLVFYGQFQNNRINGEGNFITPEGHFLRGSFKKGKLNGLSLFLKRNGDIYILKFKYGILNSKVTFFPGDCREGFLLQFTANKFRKVLKRYEFGSSEPEKAKARVVKSVFENSQLNEVLYTASDVTKVLKKAKVEGRFINSHVIGDEFAYCGLFNQSLEFNGLGLLFNFNNGKIKMGEWINQEQESNGFLIHGKYSFTGKFVTGQLDGDVLVRNLDTTDYKICHYEKGSLKKVLSEGKGQTDFTMFDYNIENCPKIKGTAFIDKDFEYSSTDSLGYSLSHLCFTAEDIGQLFEKQVGKLFNDPSEFLKEVPKRAIKPMSPHSNREFFISARDTTGPITKERVVTPDKRRSGFGDVPLKVFSRSTKQLKSQNKLHNSCSPNRKSSEDSRE